MYHCLKPHNLGHYSLARRQRPESLHENDGNGGYNNHVLIGRSHSRLDAHVGYVCLDHQCEKFLNEARCSQDLRYANALQAH